MLAKVISGGQSGVDQAALTAARAAGISTGGYAPKGFRTETGCCPWLADAGLTELPDDDYPTRTRRNVEEADGTLVLVQRPPLSGGSRLTFNLCQKLNRTRYLVCIGDGPVRGSGFGRLHPRDAVVLAVNQVSGWLDGHGVRVLNVAGTRESHAPGIRERAEAFLTELFALTNPRRADPCP